jgi:predicted N-acetyltransferase YhbS
MSPPDDRSWAVRHQMRGESPDSKRSCVFELQPGYLKHASGTVKHHEAFDNV